jgi:hypothetical protein
MTVGVPKLLSVGGGVGASPPPLPREMPRTDPVLLAAGRGVGDEAPFSRSRSLARLNRCADRWRRGWKVNAGPFMSSATGCDSGAEAEGRDGPANEVVEIESERARDNWEKWLGRWV